MKAHLACEEQLREYIEVTRGVNRRRLKEEEGPAVTLRPAAIAHARRRCSATWPTRFACTDRKPLGKKSWPSPSVRRRHLRRSPSSRTCRRQTLAPSSAAWRRSSPPPIAGGRRWPGSKGTKAQALGLMPPDCVCLFDSTKCV